MYINSVGQLYEMHVIIKQILQQVTSSKILHLLHQLKITSKHLVLFPKALALI